MDRNLWWGVRKAVGSLSLSARRAWIEITSEVSDRESLASLSARRAWIEMTSVREVFANFEGRSPQGERG